MSFLALFNQPKKIVKPYMCLACRERFHLKAHATNQITQAACKLVLFFPVAFFNPRGKYAFLIICLGTFIEVQGHFFQICHAQF